MTVTVSNHIIKHDAHYNKLRNDVRLILDLCYRKTFIHSTSRRIIEAVRLLAQQAFTCQRKVDELVDTFTKCLRTNRELHLTRK